MSNSTIFVAVASYEHPVGKAVYIKDNKIQKKKHLDRTERGNIHLMEFADLEAYAGWVKDVTPDTMRLCGTIAPEHNGHRIAYKVKPGEFLPVGSISLTNEYLAFREQGGILSIDTDYKSAGEVLGLWPEVHEFPTHEELRSLLLKAMPELEGVAMLMRDSSSSFTFSSNDVQLTGRRGIHTDIWIDDASKTPEVIDLLHTRLWAMGYGWLFVSKGARIEERSPVDRVMARPHQPDFIRAFFPDECGYSKPEFSFYNGAALKASELKPLTSEQKSLYATKLAEGHEALAGVLATAKKDRVLSIKRELVERGTNPRLANRLAEQAIEGGVLERDFILNFKELGPVSVSELVTDGERFDHQALYDPLEPDYAASVIFYWNEGRNPQIHSFAHGGRLYKLKQSAYDYVGRVQGVTLKLADEVEARRKYYEKRLGVDAIDSHRIAMTISRCFWNASSSKVVSLNRDAGLNIYSKKEFIEIELQNGWNYIDMEKLKALEPIGDLSEAITALTPKKLHPKSLSNVLSILDVPQPQEAMRLVVDDILEYIVKNKQGSSIRPCVDMFADQPSLVRDPDGVINHVRPHRPFQTNWGVDNETIERVVIDYREHFPEFDDWLDMLLAARFASSRRRAFNWLQCVSDWGKGLLTEGVLGKLGIVLKVSPELIEAALTGRPIAIDLQESVGAWVLWVDEFKSVRREFKEINESISGAGKNKMQATIPTYLKLFTSAENVESLSSQNTGIETQFAKRFTHIKGEGEIGDRALFKELGNETYRDALTSFVADKLNTKVRDYRAMGEKAAAKKAQSVLEEAHEQWGIANNGDMLSDIVASTAAEFAAYVRSVWEEKDRINRKYFGKVARLIQECEGVEVLYEGKTFGALRMLNVKKILSLWLEDRFTRDEIGKVGYKSEDIIKLVDMFGRGVHQRRYATGEGESRTAKGCFIQIRENDPSPFDVPPTEEELEAREAKRAKAAEFKAQMGFNDNFVAPEL